MIPAGDLFSTYQKAESLLASGDLREAADLCKALLDTNPEFAYGYHLMASLFQATGTYEKALSFAQMAINKAPGVAAFHIQQGRVLGAINWWQEAACAFESAHQIDHKNPLPLMLWADACHHQKKFDEACELFARARLLGDSPEIDECEGMCRVMQGDNTSAEILFDRVIKRRPDYFGAYIHRGRLLLDRKLYAHAEAAFARALKLNANADEAIIGLAIINEREGRADIAIRYAMQAIQASILSWRNHMVLGNMLVNQRHFEAAEQVLAHAHALRPDQLYILQMLCLNRRSLNRLSDAILHMSQLIEGNSDSTALRHLRAVLRCEPVETPPNDYVAAYFDGYAETYDHQQQILMYRAPSLLAGVLAALPEIEGRTGLRLLDLGCGTGLSAEPLCGMTSVRVGVDLSEAMLDKARMRRIYTRLHQADMLTFMLAGGQSFDLVVAVDVLSYAGHPLPLLKAVRNVLAPDGLLAFTIEIGGNELAGRMNGRGGYTHAPQQVRTLILEAGYEILAQEDGVLRMESHMPVHGAMFVCKKVRSH